jgi:hypothetical protein
VAPPDTEDWARRPAPAFTRRLLQSRQRLSVASSSLRCSPGEPEPSGVVNDLIEQPTNRFAILGDDCQLITEGISCRVKGHGILCAPTP